VDIWNLLGADLIQGVGYTGKAQKRNKAWIQGGKRRARSSRASEKPKRKVKKWRQARERIKRFGRAQAEAVMAILGVSRP
jgi:hypothetical protein